MTFFSVWFSTYFKGFLLGVYIFKIFVASWKIYNFFIMKYLFLSLVTIFFGHEVYFVWC